MVPRISLLHIRGQLFYIEKRQVGNLNQVTFQSTKNDLDISGNRNWRTLPEIIRPKVVSFVVRRRLRTLKWGE